jgi:O-acetyl-ADP-ribose deacetylase (regulator of RNase III)
MIELTTGNLLKTDAEALVNTVNCVGIMGKGIALQFKQAFPENFNEYAKACRKEEVKPGKMFVFETARMFNPRYIINFPTKRHWKGKSKIEDIRAGLKALVMEAKRRGIKSIAVPPLGCGNGGLEWSVIRPLMEEAFSEIPDVKILIFEPLGAPEADKMPVRTKKPNMTRPRALFIKLIEGYSLPGYRVTLLEIQKLAYFLQEAGEPLKLNFEKAKYGPYAENLHFVLQALEGHYIRGYGDRSKDANVHLIGDAIKDAELFLAVDENANARLEHVDRLIEGFETPYGMELLSTVHWVSNKEASPATDTESAVRMSHEWNERKKQVLREEHIRIAWDHLKEEGWIS